MGTSKLPILIVGSNPRNLELLAQFLNKEGYETVSAAKLEEFGEILNSGNRYGLALVDIAGFDRGIWQYCELCSNQNIPLLIISPQQLSSIRQESMSHGAQGVLFKPLVVKELVNLVNTMFLES
ncbi:MAG: response regulator [Chloroflexota bacterium]